MAVREWLEEAFEMSGFDALSASSLLYGVLKNMMMRRTTKVRSAIMPVSETVRGREKERT